jgi:two-component system phosphate regulon sensor histidine kinase PhoR
MTETQDPKMLWFGFLKVFTRALTQINLYKPDHPQVRQALDEGQALLAQIAETLGGADFSITLDSDKLLVNGVQLLTADKLPNSLRNLFTRFRIQTITFSAGATGDDLLALCQVQAHKGEAKDFLRERGIERVKLDEAVYTKVTGQQAGQPAGPGAGPGAGQGAGQEPGAGPGAGQGAGQGQGAGPGAGLGGGQGQGAAAPSGEQVSDKISGMGLEDALAAVVSRATPDQAEQRRLTELLTSKFKQEIEASINRALETIRGEKKKAENDMTRAQSVMNSIAEGVVVVDKEGKILLMNPHAEAMSGRPLAELSGKKIVDLAQIESQVVSLAREITSDTKNDISKEVAQAGAAGLAETVKKATAIIQNEDGKIVGAMSMPTDAAKLMQAEQLQQDFIANMTHELRSPLTSIKAALELMGRDAEKDATSRSMLNTAIRNTERLNSIITDILDFSKLQSGKLVLRPEDEAADEIAKEATEAMKAWANSKGINMQLRVEPELPHVYADRRRTVQILINLISNAIKFTPQGGSIEVAADAGKETLAGSVFFSVKDTGCGIKKEDQAKIFEKFVQAISGEKVGGTGLGLAITKAMVMMQGGKLSLDSEQGRGSTFRVALPVYKGQGDQPVFEAQPETRQEAKAWWKKLLGI